MEPAGSAQGAPFPTGPDQFPPSGPNSLAGLGERLVARLIDGLVLIGPFFILLAVFAGDMTDVVENAGSAPMIAFLVAQVVYEAGLIAWRGQTIGKATLGIRVARLVDGENPVPNQSTIRVAFPVAVGLLPVVGILSIVIYATAWTHPLRQGWHDRAAGTVVVRTR